MVMDLVWQSCVIKVWLKGYAVVKLLTIKAVSAAYICADISFTQKTSEEQQIPIPKELPYYDYDLFKYVWFPAEMQRRTILKLKNVYILKEQ